MDETKAKSWKIPTSREELISSSSRIYFQRALKQHFRSFRRLKANCVRLVTRRVYSELYCVNKNLRPCCSIVSLKQSADRQVPDILRQEFKFECNASLKCFQTQSFRSLVYIIFLWSRNHLIDYSEDIMLTCATQLIFHNMLL